MRQLILYITALVLLITSSVSTQGQVYTNTHNYGNQFSRGRFDTSFIFPQDTAIKDNQPTSLPRIASKNGVPYFWNGGVWQKIGATSAVDTIDSFLRYHGYTITNQIGTLLNQSFAVTSLPTTMGTSLTSGSLAYNTTSTQLSGGAGDFLNQVFYNYYSNLERVKVSASLKIVALGAGISLGIKSYSTSAIGSVAVFPLNTGSNTTTIQYLVGTSGVVKSTGSSYSIALGDSVTLSWERNYDTIYATVINYTQSYTNITKYANLVSAGTSTQLPNIGKFTLFLEGGIQNLYNYTITSTEGSNPLTIFTGTSITAGYNSGGFGLRFADRVYGIGRLTMYGVEGGPSGFIVDALNDTTELAYLFPKYATVEFGANEAIHAADTNTYKTNYTLYVKSLQRKGIIPVLFTTTPLNSFDIRPYNRQVQAIATSLGLTIVDNYSALDSAGTFLIKGIYYSDGVHPNATGHAVVAQTIQTQAPFLLTDTTGWLNSHSDTGRIISVTDINLQKIDTVTTVQRLLGIVDGKVKQTIHVPYIWISNPPTNLSYFTNDVGYLTVTPKTDVYNDQTANYLLSRSDSGKVITFNSSSATWLTIPTGLTKGFNCSIVNKGTGDVLFTDSNAVQKNWNNAFLLKQYGAATIKETSTDTLDIAGSGVVSDTTLPGDKVAGDTMTIFMGRWSWKYNNPVLDLVSGGSHQRIYCVGRDLDTATARAFLTANPTATVDTVWFPHGSRFLVQTTTANQPTLVLNGYNNRPMLSFNAGTGQYLVDPSSTAIYKFLSDGTSSSSIVGVITNQQNIANAFIMASAAVTTDVGFILYTQVNYRLTELYANGANPFGLVQANSSALQNPSVFSIRNRVTDSVSLFRGNLGTYQLAQKNTAGYDNATPSYSLTIGKRPDAGTQYNTMYLGVLSVYNSDIGQTNACYLEQYFNNYYGLISPQSSEWGIRVTKNVMSASASLSFPATSSNSSNDLTITVPGAVSGNAVILGVPAVSATVGTFWAFVSAPNTVTVRFHNTSGGSTTPATGTFNVRVYQNP